MVRGAGRNRILTNSLRTIRRSFPRFLSLLVMSALGVFVFAGLQATQPDMLASLDRHLDAGQVYDVRVVSTLGLSESDIQALSQVQGVSAAEGVRQEDAVFAYDETDYVVTVRSLTDRMDRVTLVSGRLPEAADELAVEPALLEQTGLALGSRVTLQSDSLQEETFTITGTVTSPLYYNSVSISQSRGSTSKGSGTVTWYACAAPAAFDIDYYTSVELTVSGAADLQTGSDDYEALVSGVMDGVEALEPDRAALRRQELYDSASEEIDEAAADAQEELDDAAAELADARAQLDEAAAELEDGKAELEENRQALADAEAELADGKTQLDEGYAALADAQAQLDEAEAQIADGKAQLAASAEELETNRQTLAAAKTELEENRQTLEAGQAQLDAAKAQLDEAKAALEAGQAQLDAKQQELDTAAAAIAAMTDPTAAAGAQAQYDTAAAELAAGKETLAASRAQYDAGLAEYEENAAALEAGRQEYEAGLAEYETGSAALEAGQAQYDAAAAQLAESEETFAAGQAEFEAQKQTLAEAQAAYDEGLAEYEDGQAELEDAQAAYDEGLAEYEDGEADYAEGLQEYEDAAAEAEEKTADARAELEEKLEDPEWLVYDRTGYSTYADYLDDAASVGNLSAIFPVVFFLVAVLVSLISMNRMVEEERTEIGTLKSLGFTSGRIMSKYAVFSLSATALGGLLGGALGLIIIPKLIFSIYTLLFEVPGPVLLPEWPTTLAGFAITVVCVCGTGLLTVRKVLREKPSELMRPKAPKPGKRVLLERVTFLWSRLSFSQKVTVRNLFRYKKRVIVTVGGIAGCTALMLCGFGIRDAITDLPSTQYGKIWLFDGTAYVTGLDEAGTDEVMDQAGLSDYTVTRRISAALDDLDAYIMTAPNGEAMDRIIALRDTETGEKLTLEPGGVILTEKLAAETGLQVGDTAVFSDTDGVSYALPVTGIAENYLQHFIFMTDDTLAEYREADPNLVYFNLEAGRSTADNEALAEKLLENSSVLNVSFRDDLVESADNMLTSLNKVVLILIVLAAMLAFVVLYNLSNINITERRREIATLKVLGFYDREVDSYITKETFLLTALGIVIGLALGILLSHVVVATVEIDMARFINRVKWPSFLYAAVLSSVFTLVVNAITHFHLKRIDMTGSLKSVE